MAAHASPPLPQNLPRSKVLAGWDDECFGRSALAAPHNTRHCFGLDPSLQTKNLALLVFTWCLRGCLHPGG